jgi:hypothetical protein
LGGAVVVAAVATPIVGTALFSSASAATTLPVSLVNDTGAYADSDIFVYIVGTRADGTQAFVNGDGALTPVSTSLNGADGFADLSIPFKANLLNLPQMSGRIYFSIGSKLKFKVVTDGNGKAALQFPAGWVSSDPSFNVLHDFVEFTFNDSGMFCNTTMVDMFSIPLAINLKGASNQTTGALKSGGRDAIFAGIAADSTFAPLIVGNKLRVIAPGHGLESGIFPTNFYDDYVSQVWAKYASSALTVTTNQGTFTGKVVNNQLTFNGGVTPINKPSTKSVLFCDGELAAPNDGLSGPVAAVLGAAFNRSTLLSTPAQPTTDPATFYQPAVTNLYSKVMHQNSVDGKAYGFAFDDVANFASFIQDTAPTGFTVTLGRFSGTATAGATPTASATAAPLLAAASEIPAANYSAQSGVQVEASTDVDGGQYIGWIANGDWVRYDQVDFGSTALTQLAARVASGAGTGTSGLVEVRLDSADATPIGSFAIGSTGGWQTWKTVPTSIKPTTGVHTVFLKFTSGQAQEFLNLHWFTFSS